jgi:UDPglucose 6-dehydrogenase
MNKGCGEKLALVYSPEFIALGSVIENLLNPDVILIGSDLKWAHDKHLEVTTSYLTHVPNVISLNFKEAELATGKGKGKR